MSDLKHQLHAPRLPDGAETTKVQVDALGSLHVNPTYRSLIAVTAGSSDLPYPIDAFICSANATLSVVAAEDPDSEPLPLTVVAGVKYDIALKKLVSISTGTMTGLMLRRPPEEP
jgi:hypothetical protein